MEFIHFLTFFVVLIASVISGMAGGGGSFILSPYWLIIGMSPAQSAATSAFIASGMSISSVMAFRKTKFLPSNQRLIGILMLTTVIGSIIGALVLPKIDIQAFKYLLAFITITSLPLIFIKPSIRRKLRKHQLIGLVVTVLILLVGSIITSSAFSILFALALITFFDMSVLEMTAVRRSIGVVQSLLLFIAFYVQGYFLWQHSLMGIIGGSLGSYLGTKFAIKRGEKFAKYALAIMSFIGAAALIV